MNRMISREWFPPVAGTALYLCGFNDALLHSIGVGWLKLGRITQTLVVVVVLAVVAYIVNDRLGDRRASYQAAVRAAASSSATPTTKPTTVSAQRQA